MLVRDEGKKGKRQLERKGGDVKPEPGMWGTWRSHPRGRRGRLSDSSVTL